VAAASARSAWAVGSTRAGRTLILRWNGTAWKRQPSPNLGANSFLTGVAATSARNAWAVGYADAGPMGCGPCKLLILRWNGVVWRRVARLRPASDGWILSGVAASSGRSAWAVGDNGLGGQTLTLRWNGITWKRVPSPSPGILPELNGVAAVAGKAWAVGRYETSGLALKTLILHWTGTAWKPSADHYR